MSDLSDLLQTLVGYNEDAPNSGQMAVRAVVTFAITLAIVRLGDKRMFGKGTAFDTIVAIMIGSVMSRAITASGPLIATWVAGMTLVGLHWLIALLTYHLDWFGPLVKGNPVLLIEDGEIQRDGMREGSVTRNDLEQALRAEGAAGGPSHIQTAYLERDGSISIVEREGEPRVIDVEVVDGVQTVRIALG